MGHLSLPRKRRFARTAFRAFATSRFNGSGICRKQEEARRSRRKRIRHAAETAGKFVIQLAFLIGVCYIGNAVAAAIPLGIPGNFVSMVLLLGLLITGMLQATKIDLISSFLLKYMPVFFIPAGVSVMGCFPMIADHLPQFALVALLTTVLVFLVTSLTVTAVITTGVLGTILSPTLAKLFRIRSKIEQGVAIGTCSHATGTTKALEMGELEGAMSGVAIAVSGLLTCFIVIGAQAFFG